MSSITGWTPSLYPETEVQVVRRGDNVTGPLFVSERTFGLRVFVMFGYSLLLLLLVVKGSRHIHGQRQARGE